MTPSPHSLQREVILRVAAILGVLLALALGLDSAIHLRLALTGASRNLEVLGDAVENALRIDMREGRSWQIQQILEEVGRGERVEGLRIVDPAGRVLRSSKPEELGVVLSVASLPSHGSTVAQPRPGLLRLVRPIHNEPACHRCHEPSQALNGVLLLDYSLTDDAARVRRHAVLMAALLVLSVSAAGLAIAVLLRRRVAQPLRAMREAMATAESGDLQVALEVTSSNEIGALQVRFNQMMNRVAQLNVQTLSQQRDLAQKERELAVQQALAAKNQALEVANREITEKNRYYLEMLGFISHEMKGPLQVLKGYSRLLLSGAMESGDPRAREALEGLARNSDALEAMLANYLDLARLERGELAPERRHIDLLSDVLEPLLEELRPAAQMGARTLRLAAATRPFPLEADPALLRSALGNVVGNALKYGRPESEICVDAQLREGRAQVSVHNEGRGIPSSDLERVFERFTRLDNEATRHQKGSGLGLWIVREIARRHGGEAWAESEEGSWTRIVVSLPV